MMNLFDCTSHVPNEAINCKRSANANEIETYLRWIAARDHVAVPDDATFGTDGIYSRAAKAITLPMPGYGASELVTCEILDDAGGTVRTIKLPVIPNGAGAGKVNMTAAQVKDWTGLKPMRASRKASAAPIVAIEAPAPVMEQAERPRIRLRLVQGEAVEPCAPAVETIEAVEAAPVPEAPAVAMEAPADTQPGYVVTFASLESPGKVCTERYDTLGEAVAACRIMYDRGNNPAIGCDDFKAVPMTANKWADRPVFEWSLTFKSVDGYKGRACRIAERSGVRYASHRKGYRASTRAFSKFVAAWSEAQPPAVAIDETPPPVAIAEAVALEPVGVETVQAAPCPVAALKRLVDAWDENMGSDPFAPQAPPRNDAIEQARLAIAAADRTTESPEMTTDAADLPTDDSAALLARIAKLESIVDDLMVIALREAPAATIPMISEISPARDNAEPAPLPVDPRARAVVTARDTRAAEMVDHARAKRLRMVRRYLAMRAARRQDQERIAQLQRALGEATAAAVVADDTAQARTVQLNRDVALWKGRAIEAGYRERSGIAALMSPPRMAKPMPVASGAIIMPVNVGSGARR